MGVPTVARQGPPYHPGLAQLHRRRERDGLKRLGLVEHGGYDKALRKDMADPGL
jgi:hypothetical protein